MAAPGKGSKWGSFLTSAVAGVESRLDNMLSEAEGGVGVDDSRDPTTDRKKQPERQAPMSVPSAASNSRSSSSNRTNDRLQARLAKAMAGKGSQGDSKGLTSPRDSIDGRSSTDRPSMEVANGHEKDDTKAEAATATSNHSTAPTTTETTPANKDKADLNEKTHEQGTETAESVGITQPKEAPSTADINAPAKSTPAEQPPPAPSISPSDLSNLAKDMDEIKTRQQEEIQEYVERIDSLQSKLQYLSRREAESAKKAANAAPSGSAERKIAERDEKIALLMEEGQKLSSAEGKFRATIKRLRQQMSENEKQTDAARKEKQKAISDLDALKNRLDGNEEKEKRQEEARKATAALQKEVDSLKKERAAKDEAIRKMEQDLKAKTEKAEAASIEAHNKELAAEREKHQTLEAAIAALKAENESLADKARLESLEWSEKLERAAERNRTMEAEMKNELKMMENKLEAMRSAAEEASSGTGGEGQIKLIRQIETLQSQYATASDNWQGIEASLLAKAANLEKERDEAQRRESEMRKKARDAASRSRKLEDDLQELHPELTSTKQELESVRDQLNALRTSSKSTETALEQARADLEKQQRAAAREFQEDQSRRQWADEVSNHPSPRMQNRPESPLLPLPRTFSSDLVGFQAPSRSRRTPVGSIPDSPLDGPRRMSSQPPGRQNALSPGSGQPPTPFSPFEPPSQPSDVASPSLAGRDDPIEDKVPSSPRHVAQDMISVSTVGAGPSVQLVERMSAAIRRLEGEKVAAKEEMTRVCSQRDEARSDMVGLMKEVESAKAATSKVEQVEKELADVNARYQTTLEMLGEKSELVEELRADVQDVKAMYRELVERTVK